MKNLTEDILTREYDFTFVDKTTGKKEVVRASDTELATLKAWAKNRNLTFDVNAIDRSENNDKTGTPENTKTENELHHSTRWLALRNLFRLDTSKRH